MDKDTKLSLLEILLIGGYALQGSILLLVNVIGTPPIVGLSILATLFVVHMIAYQTFPNILGWLKQILLTALVLNIIVSLIR